MDPSDSTNPVVTAAAAAAQPKMLPLYYISHPTGSQLSAVPEQTVTMSASAANTLTAAMQEAGVGPTQVPVTKVPLVSIQSKVPQPTAATRVAIPASNKPTPITAGQLLIQAPPQPYMTIGSPRLSAKPVTQVPLHLAPNLKQTYTYVIKGGLTKTERGVIGAPTGSGTPQQVLLATPAHQLRPTVPTSLTTAVVQPSIIGGPQKVLISSGLSVLSGSGQSAVPIATGKPIAATAIVRPSLPPDLPLTTEGPGRLSNVKISLQQNPIAPLIQKHAITTSTAVTPISISLQQAAIPGNTAAIVPTPQMTVAQTTVSGGVVPSTQESMPVIVSTAKTSTDSVVIPTGGPVTAATSLPGTVTLLPMAIAASHFPASTQGSKVINFKISNGQIQGEPTEGEKVLREAKPLMSSYLPPSKSSDSEEKTSDGESSSEKSHVANKSIDLPDFSDGNFDPTQVLEWKDGIGTLPGSDLKFKMNEFGLVEMVDSEDVKSLIPDESDIQDKENQVQDKEKLVQEKAKSPAMKNNSIIDESPKLGENEKSDMKPAEEVVESVSSSTAEEQSKVTEKDDHVTPAEEGETEKSSLVATSDAKIKTEKPQEEESSSTNKQASSKDEIWRCENCGCYGLPLEFLSTLFCSEYCEVKFNKRKAIQLKREQELKEMRNRKKKKKKVEEAEEKQSEPVDESENSLDPADVSLQTKVKDESVTPPLSEEEDEAMDDGETDSPLKSKSWYGKTGFSWARYLEHCKAQGCPVKLFKDPFPYQRNMFKTGMKLEGIDPEHPNMFCVLSVAEILGYRIRLHFEEFPDLFDFWVNADSMNIFPPGWCEKNGHKLIPPKGHTSNFNWSTYLRHTKAQPAPKQLFAHKAATPICPNGFRVGMKLEAVDKKNTSLVCVATIMDVMDNRFLVHFDGWDDIYDYWADPTSPYIHPVGWCQENNHALTPPNNCKNIEKFTWDDYLNETKAVPVPARAFKMRQPCGFKVGQRLETVDIRNPALVRIATVADINGHQLKLNLDGWSSEYDFWVDDDCPDIHPPGWCFKTGHPLQPPFSVDDPPPSSNCPTPGCSGYGNMKGPKFATHSDSAHCPYSQENMSVERPSQDRLYNKGDVIEQKEPVIIRDRKPGRPKKLVPSSQREGAYSDIRVKTEPEMKKEPSQNYMEFSRGKKRIRRHRFLNSIPTFKRLKSENEDSGPLQLSIQHTVLHPGYQPNPDPVIPFCWEKHHKVLDISCGLTLEDVRGWSQDAVAEFVASIKGCEDNAKIFKEERIDGESFLMLTQNDLIKLLGVKLGPAIKVINTIMMLRTKV